MICFIKIAVKVIKKVAILISITVLSVKLVTCSDNKSCKGGKK